MVGCTYCQKAKSRLRSENIAYQEIDIDMYPSKHKAAQEDSKLFTVPVIYFGGKLIGGNDDMQQLAKEGELGPVVDREYSVHANLPEWLILTEEDLKEGAERKRVADEVKAKLTAVDLPGLANNFRKAEGATTYNEVVALLTGPEGPKLENRGGIICAQAKECATGKDIIACLTKHLWNGDRKMGQRFGSLMMKFKMIVAADPQSERKSCLSDEEEKQRTESQQQQSSSNPLPQPGSSELAAAESSTTTTEGGAEQTAESSPVSMNDRLKMPKQPVVLNSLGKDIQLQDSESVYYHFQDLRGGNSLNMHRIYDPLSSNTPRPADEVSVELRKRLSSLLAQFMDAEGVDYAGLGASDEFRAFRDATTELQTVDLGSLSREGLIAFGINVYNSCIIHAFCTVGPPTSTWQRYKFFNGVGYHIAGHHYCLNDIEQGILRQNRKAPMGAFSPQFDDKDPRRHHIVNPVDHRIHFALNCGAKSCPSIKVFSENDLDNQLQKASLGFLESSEWNSSSKKLKVTKIVDWYMVDFGEDPIATVLPYLHKLPQDAIKKAHAAGEVKLEFFEYDWSVNSKPTGKKKK